MADDSRIEVIVAALRSELHTSYTASSRLANVAFSALETAGYSLHRSEDIARARELTEALSGAWWYGEDSDEQIVRIRQVAAEIVELLEKPDA